MRCLCCGKEIKDNPFEQSCLWHRRCIKSFFGTSELPELELNESIIRELAQKNTSKGFTVTGVQKKISLHLSEGTNEKPRLTLVNYPTGYILKPQTDEYPNLPEAEYVAMRLAGIVGISTVPFALIRISGGEYSYITKRIDRVRQEKLAMEDFCQLDGRLTEDKYKGSYERCGKIISTYSSQSMLDMTELFLRVAYSFVIGNSDMHLKNFSLIEMVTNSGLFSLSPAYDLLPVNVVNPADTEQVALTMNGKKRNLHRGDFLKYADSIGLSRKVAERLIDKIVMQKGSFISETENSYLPDELKEKLCCLIENRVDNLL